MEGRKKSGTLRRSFYSAKKRLAAWVLAAAMICTNVGTDPSVAYAAESSETVTFEMYGSDLVTAIEDAIASDHAVSPGDFDFTNGDIGEFENLFFGEGKVLEAYPAVENESIDAEVRVFVRLPEDADNAYMVTGEEELIFLYVNNGEDTISCRTTIYDDEGEKLKTTKAVKVRSFEDAFGEEEVNYISKPVETVPSETQPEAGPGAPEESESAAPTEPETGTPEESESAAPTEPETSAPEESESAEPTEPETSAPEESESAAPTEPETSAPEESESAEPTEPEAAPSAEESAEESKEETEAETEAEEKPQTMEEAEPQESVTAQISRHNAPMVAETEAEKTEETEEKEPESTEESEEESKGKEKEESTEESFEEETEESTEASSEAGSEESTEASSEAGSEESTEASSEAGSEESTEASSEAGTEESTPAETTQAESTAPATPSQPQAPQEKPQTDSVNKADVNDLVGIGNSSTAKAYVTTLNKLDAFEAFIGYRVSYAVYPEGSARIVEGPKAVREGEALSFGVVGNEASEITDVSINGQVIEPESEAADENGFVTKWYMIPEITEEQSVEIQTQQVMMTMPMLLSLYANETVTVTVQKTDGSNPETVDLPVGMIAENAPSMEGYDFVNAKVDNTIVKMVAVDGATDTTYVTTDENQLTGIALEDSTDPDEEADLLNFDDLDSDEFE